MAQPYLLFPDKVKNHLPGTANIYVAATRR